MKQKFVQLFLLLLIACMGWVSCKDDYLYDNEEPDFLGASIYDFMQEDGHFTYFLKLVDDMGYKEVLSRTGSKTLFPARDDAFERFFQGNAYGVRSYEDLSPAQKRNIMNVSMVNMAYLSYMLSNVSGNAENPAGEGQALRKYTANTFLDSIPYSKNENFFAANSYWERFKTKGIYLIPNEASSPLVYFTPANMQTRGITTEDFATFSHGLAYTSDDIYINGIRMKKNENNEKNRDIICKNGYIHVMEDLLLPPLSMADVIQTNGETNLFNHLMDKFSMPYYVENLSNQAHTYYDGSNSERPLIPVSDSVFVKRYFTESFNTDQSGNPLTNYGLLYYDPSNRAYNNETDMGTMFVPTDKALNDYINGEKGYYLKDAYGSWNKVPTSLLALFLKNHQKKSFLSALPHLWPEMNDESSFAMHVTKGDIENAYIASNGIVYVTNTVYPPIDYQSVYAATMTSGNTKTVNRAIQDNDIRNERGEIIYSGMKFYLYLRSMENQYNLLVPVDEALKNYRDPISWARAATGNGSQTDREIWEFRYVPESDMVYADVYKSDVDGNKVGTPTLIMDRLIIKNRLNDIMDMHIVVADEFGFINNGTVKYAQTKGGATLKVSGSGDATKITGGGDLEINASPAAIEKTYNSDNGKAYFIDKVLQDPVKSVYTVLGEHPEYKYFFDLLNGQEFTDAETTPVFGNKKTQNSSGIGYVVNSFNNFRYTVFVPTKEALEAAFADDPNLWTWEQIKNIDPNREDYQELRKEKTIYLLEFLKYHFVDNSIFISGKPVSGEYETAARNSSGKFRKVSLQGNGADLEVTGNNPAYKAKVIKTEGLYNVQTRDYIINNSDLTMATQIESSSRAVIHLIDNVLRYE
jgi:uncharacterized surface protein with fasciclin (FAS1) repeats